MPRPRSCLLFARPSASSWLVVLALAWLFGLSPLAFAVAPSLDSDKPLTSLVRLPKVAHPLRYAADLQLVPTADSFTGRIDIDRRQGYEDTTRVCRSLQTQTEIHGHDAVHLHCLTVADRRSEHPFAQHLPARGVVEPAVAAAALDLHR